MISFEDVKNNKEFTTYVEKGNAVLGVLGYTDHSQAHTLKVGETAARILKEFGYSDREQELAKIAGYIHDIGNVVHRIDHAQTGAVMAFSILTRMGMDPAEIADVIAAIGNHNEDAGIPVSPVSASLIIADKTDVRRSRVRNKDFATFDIHDRVNYAVEKSALVVDATQQVITLDIMIDTDICSVMDYFEIFLTRMVMCRRACEYINAVFHLIANETMLL